MDVVFRRITVILLSQLALTASQREESGGSVKLGCSPAACYSYHSDKYEWQEAREVCASQGMHMATPEGEDESYQLYKLLGKVRKSNNFNVWLGGRQIRLEEAQWLPDGKGKRAEHVEEDIEDASTEGRYVRHRDTDELCGAFGALAEGEHDRLMYIGCHQSLPYVCEDTDGNNLFSDSNRAPWYEALSFCQAQGGMLTRQPESANIADSSRPVWVGFVNNYWAWYRNNGSEERIIETAWGLHDPSSIIENCMIMETTGNWGDVRCDTGQSIVCQREVRDSDRNTDQEPSKKEPSDGIFSTMNIIYMGAGGLVLVLLIIITVICIRRKKNKLQGAPEVARAQEDGTDHIGLTCVAPSSIAVTSSSLPQPSREEVHVNSSSTANDLEQRMNHENLWNDVITATQELRQPRGSRRFSVLSDIARVARTRLQYALRRESRTEQPTNPQYGTPGYTPHGQHSGTVNNHTLPHQFDEPRDAPAGRVPYNNVRNHNHYDELSYYNNTSRTPQGSVEPNTYDNNRQKYPVSNTDARTAATTTHQTALAAAVAARSAMGTTATLAEAATSDNAQPLYQNQTGAYAGEASEVGGIYANIRTPPSLSPEPRCLPVTPYLKPIN